MKSTKPYLIRAFYEWISDSGLTPYVTINTTFDDVVVPEQHINNGQIVLNISQDAVTELHISNKRLQFEASFNQIPFQIFAPIKSIEAIYAAENGRGMAFDPNEFEDDDDGDSDSELTPESNQQTPPKKGKPSLKVIK